MPNHQAKAPQCDGQVSGNGLEHQHTLTYKSKASKKTYKKKNNQWIGKCDGKCRYEVMEIGPLLVDTGRMDCTGLLRNV